MQQSQVRSGNLNLPSGVELAGLGSRTGALVLDIILVIFTLVIGWLIWSVIIWSRGQSPGKQIVGIRVARMDDGVTADWGLMFVREVLLKWLVVSVLLNPMTGSIAWWVDNLWAFFDANRQTLHDKVVKTVVVRSV